MQLRKFEIPAFLQKPHRLLVLIGIFFRVWVWHIISFTFVLLCYLTYHLLEYVLTFRLIPKKIQTIALSNLEKVYFKLVLQVKSQERTINRVNLIELALRNMLFKKSRAMITVGGMAIGIGAIVFLVSIGFGLQELVIRRVARLDELRQTDVVTQPGSKTKINDQTISSLQELSGVEKVLPVIATVARVSFRNSISDMAVYGVTTDYLASSAIQPHKGELFDSNEIASSLVGGRVAGISTADSPDSQQPHEKAIQFSINDGVWVKVRSQTSRSSELLGYAKRGVGNQQGKIVWGQSYPEAVENKLTTTLDNRVVGPWIEGQFSLWEKKPCAESDLDCSGGEYQMILDENGQQVLQTGYIAQINTTVEQTGLVETHPAVLGLSSSDTLLAQAAGSLLNEETSDNIASDSSDPAAFAITSADPNSEWVEIASESANTAQEQIIKVSLAATAKKLAVVNIAMLKVLGIEESEAIGQTFSASFIVVGDLLDKSSEKVESIPADYVIVGIVPEDKSAYFYVPFIDLRGLGINNYTQLKVVADNPDVLAMTRKQIEAQGYTTSSVADTVKQIDRLFATARVVLAIVGMVALAIAALGMFNTLTVSLLERTREVGLMKAMGMKSHEVQELFLAESLVMGFFGGILGIVFGFGAGKLLGLLLSIFSVTQGAGVIDIAYLPLNFVGFIFILSLVVGIFTGIYPAQRATHISALNALRYE